MSVKMESATNAVPQRLRAGSPGAGRPSLVFLHGIGGRASGWQAQLDALAAEGWHALAWDMPGYGDSLPVRPYDFDGLADALVRLLDAEGLARAVLVGHSLGGMVALQTWARHPSRVAALVLAATSPAFGHGSGDFQRAFVAQRLGPLDAGQGMAEVAASLVPAMMAPATEPATQARAQACMASVSPHAYRLALQALVRFDQRAALPTITVPTLCLAGGFDRTAAPSVLRRMADKIPGAVYDELPQAGHLMNFEQPQAFTDVLRRFLQTAKDLA